MSPKESGPDRPSAQDLAAFAKEYFRAYMEAVSEKKTDVMPQFAQDSPYLIRSYLMPNGCIAMVFTSSKDLQVEGALKDWEEVQGVVVKGVDHFAGFYPFEGRTLADWNKRGRRDALRDLRLLDRSQLVKASAELEMVIEDVVKKGKLNPWIDKEHSLENKLRSVDSRIKAGFPTVDAIANLQSLKAYTQEAQAVTIEFPERGLLEEISEGIRNLASVQSKLETFENRMFEIEKATAGPTPGGKFAEVEDRVGRLEKQLEKVSNILTMINTKVETYFSKTAERERQSDLERRIEDHTSRSMSQEARIADIEREAERLVDELRKMTASINKDIHESRKRIARMEKHFVDFGKMVQE